MPQRRFACFGGSSGIKACSERESGLPVAPLASRRQAGCVSGERDEVAADQRR